MRRPAVPALLLPLLLCAGACATSAPRERLSFAELYARPASAAAARPVVEPLRAGPGALDAAVAHFVAEARALREATPRGAPMPQGAVDAWERVGQRVDAALGAQGAAPPEAELARARAALEAALDADGAAYGDVPAALAEAALTRAARLALRASVLQRRREAARALAWPLPHASVTSLFGRRVHPVTGVPREHLGLDLAADRGEGVEVAAAGVVVLAGWNGSHGLQVAVSHPGGRITRYSHLSRVLVRPGESLRRGDVVGLVGSTGLSTGPHLHFEVWQHGEPVDPLDVLGPAPDEVGGRVADRDGDPDPGTRKGRRPSGRRPL